MMPVVRPSSCGARLETRRPGILRRYCAAGSATAASRQDCRSAAREVRGAYPIVCETSELLTLGGQS